MEITHCQSAHNPHLRLRHSTIKVPAMSQNLAKISFLGSADLVIWNAIRMSPFVAFGDQSTISARRSSAQIQGPIVKLPDGNTMLLYLRSIMHLDSQLRSCVSLTCQEPTKLGWFFENAILSNLSLSFSFTTKPRTGVLVQ
ncbi:hypothetical protein GALMADRAFT_583017 [Galerina marginata CBS 339.88]|uniref:Uncharacterized protein n=1 Tax=Galerina marginata (strain CBS 339.88) TaxID=685588 RepID=A0A067SU13_GALM3|nr:hypothetical protein GALMADRAFT_583017 [Galerina marginata CBS 339.88]